MKVKESMLLFVLLLCCTVAMAQTRVSVIGSVTGNDGLPLPGVSAVVKVAQLVVFQPTLMGSTKFKLLLMKYLNLAL